MKIAWTSRHDPINLRNHPDPSNQTDPEKEADPKNPRKNKNNNNIFQIQFKFNNNKIII